MFTEKWQMFNKVSWWKDGYCERTRPIPWNTRDHCIPNNMETRNAGIPCCSCKLDLLKCKASHGVFFEEVIILFCNNQGDNQFMKYHMYVCKLWTSHKSCFPKVDVKFIRNVLVYKKVQDTGRICHRLPSYYSSHVSHCK